MEYRLSECVIVIKSGEAVTTLHKEIRQAFEVVTKLGNESWIFKIPRPNRVYIETYKKECELWIKIVFDGNYVLCDMKFPPNSIFDLEGRIKCRQCKELLDLNAENSSQFPARFPRIVIHVKRQQPTFVLRTTLKIELCEALELLTHSFFNKSNSALVKQAIFTKTIPKSGNAERLAKVVLIDNPEDVIFDGEQINEFSTVYGKIRCHKCEFTYP